MIQTKFRNNKVVLYKRSGNDVFQARMKIGKGTRGWSRFSTFETDPVKAGKIACERYDKNQVRVELGLSPDSRTFKHCAKVAEQEMVKRLEDGTGKVIYTDYIRTLHKYLIPFFGKKMIDTIRRVDIDRFEAYRIKVLGRPPAKSTVSNHNATLRRVFDIAVLYEWIKEVNLPKLSNNGTEITEQEIRPWFDKEELRELLKFLKGWQGTGIHKKTQQIRTVLYHYVVLIAYTGIRPGTEAMGIRFCDVGTFMKDEREWLKITVSGKTGSRVVSAGSLVNRTILDIIMSHPNFRCIDDWTMIDPYESERYIFELEATGEPPKNLSRVFKQALETCGLLKDKQGKVRTLYSLRHTYATLVLLARNTNIHKLARHMGTSVDMLERHYSKFTSMHEPETLTILDSFEDDFGLTIDRDEMVKRMKAVTKKNRDANFSMAGLYDGME